MNTNNDITSNLQKFVKSNFTMYHRNELGQRNYFCLCGQKNTFDYTQDIEVYDIKATAIDNMDDLDIEDTLRQVNFTCTKCGANYMEPQHYSKIQNVGEEFLEKFDISENKNEISLIKFKVNTFVDSKEESYECDIKSTYITINKTDKSIKYKSWNEDAIIIDLRDVVSVSKIIFETSKDTTVVEGFINIHDFIGRISKLVIDATNMNIIGELMEQMVGKSGIAVLQKVLSILMGIICYPNLSTLSLTKGNVFLYNLLEKYPMPTIDYLKSQNATSPIKIFNALVILKNSDIQDSIDQDDRSKLGYKFKSDLGKEYLIKYDLTGIKSMDEADKLLKSGAKIFVREARQNIQISNFIFNKIKTLQDYENIIQWLKFITYENIIQLVMKYDLELLNIVFGKIEFRDDISWSRIQQFITLMISYNDLQLSDEGDKTIQKRVNKLAIANSSQYESVKYYDFNLYDDCLRMILELEWDPAKVLYKTKDFKKLVKLHEDLLKFRSYVSEKDLNEKYILASEKYKYLEGTKKGETSTYNFDIKLIPTPLDLMNEAIEMHNCAGSYINKVAKNIYIPFVLYDNSEERTDSEFHKYMMIFEVTLLGLELVGVKSRFNKYGSDRFKKDIMDYLIDNDISFKEIPSIRLGVQSSETSYDGTFAKISHLNA